MRYIGVYGGLMKIYLSFHRDENKDDIERIKKMFSNPLLNTMVVDASIEKNFSDMTEEETRALINQNLSKATVTVCLITQKTKNDPWVLWELQESIAKNRGIIGIVMEFHEKEIKNFSDCPPIFDGQRYRIIFWDTNKKLLKAIEEAEIRC